MTKIILQREFDEALDGLRPIQSLEELRSWFGRHAEMITERTVARLNWCNKLIPALSVSEIMFSYYADGTEFKRMHRPRGDVVFQAKGLIVRFFVSNHHDVDARLSPREMAHYLCGTGIDVHSSNPVRKFDPNSVFQLFISDTVIPNLALMMRLEGQF